MGDQIELKIVFNVGGKFKEVKIKQDKTSTLAFLYQDVIEHFGNDGNESIDVKIGMLLKGLKILTFCNFLFYLMLTNKKYILH